MIFRNINTYLSIRAKCWLRGGVGGQFTNNVLNDPGTLWYNFLRRHIERTQHPTKKFARVLMYLFAPFQQKKLYFICTHSLLLVENKYVQFV